MFSGHLIRQEGIRPNPEEVKAVAELTAPKCKKDIHKLLGLMNYYQKFIKGCAQLPQPILHLEG